MKIEMGESLMLSWTKHVKHCQIATLNWKCSKGWIFHNQNEVHDLIKKINIEFSNEIFGRSTADQIISQAELDVLGINIDNNIVKNIYAIDVAFHENGLHYNKDKKLNNLNKITEKFLRSALILYSVFNVKTGNIVFASPKVQPKDEKELIERTQQIESFMKSLGFDYKFLFLCNQNFYTEIFAPVQQAAIEESDTSELFMRCLQMVSLFQRQNTVIQKEKTVVKTFSRIVDGTRQSGSTTDYKNNLVAFCFSCGHHDLYPLLSQDDALNEAANKLGIKKTTLSNLRDAFDRHNPHSHRKGWDKALNPVQQQILNQYVNNVQGAFNEAKKILKLV